MNNSIKFIFSICITLFLVSCDQILEPVRLGNINQDQYTNLKEQDEFNIILKTLTFNEANNLKLAPYKRDVMVTGVGKNANVYNENKFLKINLPPEINPETYRLGIGDELTLIQFQKESQVLPNNLQETNMIQTVGRVGSDGSVLLLGVGSIKASNRSINEVRTEVRNVIIRKGLSPNFQLELTDFLSKKAYLKKGDQGSSVINLSDRPLTLQELISNSDYQSKNGYVNVITLKRGKEVYKLTIDELFNLDNRKLYIQDNDNISITSYEYKPGQVFAISGASKAAVVPIDPAKRETMADIIFKTAGPIANTYAQRSEIYLLRGRSPTMAYHLDAQNVSRILVAANMELRPNDIIFAAQRPIVSFTRLLAEISPLRTLLRDIKNNNIP